tara:strand:- start:3358 stop:4221 length:864 start_codon:yes stop_codon:yes gene_type:complete
MARKTKIQVHTAVMLPAEFLVETPSNSNKQNRHTYKELKDNIREQGFDETLNVVPHETLPDHYTVVCGNHRLRAGKELGMAEFPCVIRKDWNEVEATIQGIRRNYVRGKIDKVSFTAQVDFIKEKYGLSQHVISERMGFEDADMFSVLYQEQKLDADRQAQIAAAVSLDHAPNTSAANVKLIDDLGTILSHIFDQHGHTVPCSFIVFPAGGRNHMYVQANSALVKHMSAIAEQCLRDDLDINVALGGLLAVGMAQTGFGSKSMKRDKIKSEGTKKDGADTLPLIPAS